LHGLTLSLSVAGARGGPAGIAHMLS